MLQQEALVCIFRKSGWFIDFLQSTMYVNFSFLDVDDVKFVINYDFPGAVEDYIHRSYIARIFDNCRIIFLCSNRSMSSVSKGVFPQNR